MRHKTAITSFALVLSSVSAHATVIGFGEDGHPNFSSNEIDYYHGYYSYTPGNGYINVAQVTSTNYLAFNSFEASPATLTWTNPGSFYLNGFTIAGAWGSQTITVNGFHESDLLYSTALDISVDPIIFVANWENITALQFNTGNNYERPAGLDYGWGKQWALNDVVIDEASSYFDEKDNQVETHVFEPATSGLLMLSVAAIAALRRKSANINA